ncbi:heterogeneous nuclear ribonucleoprotein C-like 1 [Diadema setosum]|uniref:heterogeneous nuclear ribonucleoprotein C-like 1 n=1 Tax=Diadema setosum TaxID=31175 RepID=UPI003B3B0C78
MHRNYNSGYGHHGGHQGHHHGPHPGGPHGMGMGMGMGMGGMGMGLGMGMPNMGPHHNMGGGMNYNKYPAVSNYTNDMSPTAKASRVFVGNLNTYTRKEDRKNIMELVMETFMKYGRIRGISIHSGFGFVQFETSEQAKNAIRGEQGRLVKNQPLDLYLASDPDMNRPKGFKKVNHDCGYVAYVDPSTLPTIPAKGPTSQKKRHRLTKSGDEPQSWVCVFCQHEAITAWELMKHASAIHQTQIYDMGGVEQPKAEGQEAMQTQQPMM